MTHVIHPGEYFIELEFDRPVEPAILHRALTSMGFGVVVFDQSLPTVEFGAVPRARVIAAPSSAASSFASAVKASTTSVSASSPVVSAVRAPAPAPVSAPKPAIVAPAPAAPASSTRTVMEVQSRYTPSSPTAPVMTSKPSPARIADGGGAAALRPSPTVVALAALQKQSSPTPGSIVANPARGSASLPATKAPFPGDVVAHPPVSPPAGTVAQPDAPAPARPVPVAPVVTSDVPASSLPPPTPAPPEPKAQFVAPTESSSYVTEEEPEQQYEPPPPPPASPEPQSQAPSPVSPAPSPSGPALVAKALTELWTKWKEWGSPFASGPMTVSGEESVDDNPLRFRILARLDRPIALNDTPYMRWLFVKALSVPLLSADLAFQSNPHPLKPGRLYEIRFLSRAKSNPTRDSVKQSLTDMGFQPLKLLAIKRNMKLPNRPASLTLWYGMAVWNRADSVIVHDDPFFFETVKEIRPL